MRILLTTLVLLCSMASRAQQTELADLLRQKHVPGIQLIHTKSGKSTAYVLGTRQNGAAAAAVDARTTFQAASLGKVVLAYTALRLHDQGLLALDKPLLSYHDYPRLRTQPSAGRITARMVLTHMSGLPNWAENPLGNGWKTSALRLRFSPDSCWNYSGEGFVLLQQTLEHLTGKSWEELAQQEVFKPLGMWGSSFKWQARFARNASFGHDKAGKPTEIRQFAQANAGFTLLTTAADYNRFVQVLLTGTGLSAASRALLTTPLSTADRCRTPASPTDPFIAWAAGVGLATTSRGPALWHWGDNGDFQGFFMALPATQESVVFFTNSANGLQLTDDVLRLFFGPGQYWAMQWLAEEK